MSLLRGWTMFTAFKRRHYNKSPLIWISNYIYWKDNAPHIASLLEKNISVLDEYPVENCHSIIRRNTEPHDTSATIVRKVKLLFGNKDCQSNFRESFTLEKNYAISQNRLEELKYKAAKFIVKVLESICAQGQEVKIYTGKTQEQAKWKLPALFGENLMDSRVLPLGYQCSWEQHPSEHKECDLSNCKATINDKDWYICEGCSHSYHTICLQPSKPCPACHKMLQNKARELATTAKAAIISPNKETEAERENEDEDKDEDIESLVDNRNSQDAPDLTSKVQALNNTIANLQPSELSPIARIPLQLETVQLPKKPPHCRNCSHASQGHKVRRNSTAKMCAMCPDNNCSSSGKDVPCSCSWHTLQSNSSKLVNGNRDPLRSRNTINPPAEQPPQNSSYLPPPGSQQTQDGHGNSLTTTLPPVIQDKVFIMPSSYSQSTLHGQNGSNACTIIACLLAKQILAQSIPPLISATNSPSLSPQFVTMVTLMIVQGNRMHESLHQQTNQLNYSPTEVCSMNNKNNYYYVILTGCQ